MEIFEDAVELPAAERKALLQELCADDAALYREVERLLSCDDGAGEFLPSRVGCVGLGDSAADAELAQRLVGKEIGGYLIEGVIASGGMGIVYEAIQREPRRTVALKLMRQGIASGSALRRFQDEAQLLASLRHPGIAQVFEAGVHDDGSGGVPFFAMEFIPGARHILAYADEEQLGTKDRLRLVADVCDAVNHGHQKGIIHRDLKPANILVDSSGQPKVIDFGVAKATNSDLAVTTQRTDVGELIGTLQYMSPEQCDADPLELDIRSDVYSLGVVLYELLTGQLPYETSSTTIYQATKTIKEAVPRRLSSINPKLRGDVETIVLKALEKDRSRRYGSAADLAQDLRRHLNWEPITARPASLSYKLAKYVRRRRWQAASIGAASIAVAATAVVGIVTHFLFDARQQRHIADVLAYGQRNAAIETALSINDVGTARKLLDRADPALRGWEWSYLENGLDQSLLTLGRAGRDTNAIRYSPSGRWLASASYNEAGGTLTVWDLESVQDGHDQTVVREIFLSETDVNFVVFSPDERWIAAQVKHRQSSEAHVQIWDARTGQTIVELPGTSPGFGAIVFDPAGLFVLASTGEGTILIWDTSTWEPFATLSGHDRSVGCLAFSPDGRTLASGSSDCTIRIWDVHRSAGARRVRTLMAHDDHVMSLAFRPPNGQVLASASMDGSIKLWDMTGILSTTTQATAEPPGVEPYTLHRRAGWVRSIDFSPDGRHLAAGGSDRVIRIWNLDAAHILPERSTPARQWPVPRIPTVRTLRGNEHPVAQVEFSPQGDSLATLGQDGEIKLWHAGGDSRTTTLEGFMSSVFDVAFDPRDPRIIAAADGSGDVQFWDVERSEKLLSLTPRYEQAYALAFHPSRSWCAVTSRAPGAGAVEVWDYKSLQRVLPLIDCGHDVRAVAFSPDGTLLAWGGDVVSPGQDGQMQSVYVWSMGEEDPTPLGAQAGAIQAIAFGADGSRLASAGEDSTVRVWDVASGKLVHRLTGHTMRIHDVTFDPKGRWIASASDDETIILWDAASGQRLRALEGHSDGVQSIAFSPDGDRLVSASTDSTLMLWDPQTGIAVATLRGHLDRVHSVAWSADGKRIASCGSGWSGVDNTVRVWEMETLRDVLTARAQANLDRELVFGHVEALFDELFFAQRVIEAIRVDRWFEARGQDTERLRDVAIQLAFVQGSNPWRTLDGCWRSARSRHQSVETYRMAEQLGRVYYDRFSVLRDEQGRRAHTIYGMTLYRLDRCDEALAILQFALELNGDNATDLAFLTMCQYRLGDLAAANATHQRLRALLSGQQYAFNPDDQEAVDEVDDLLAASTQITNSSK